MFDLVVIIQACVCVCVTLVIVTTSSLILTSVLFYVWVIHAIIHKTNTNSYLKISYHVFKYISCLN